ncbi:hypothetical protein [Actinoplanes sp. OR16]|uniref:hypothetical protein n=1 Tax=Actinoplanes sp. OR16 TaxID=946334 RepID=UPI0018D5109A|nr:hypothetical protein [Actinoplanes sp. OR16]
MSLLGEFLPERLALLLFLARRMVDAIDDFFEYGTGQVAGLHDRFLSWVPLPPPAGGGEGSAVVPAAADDARHGARAA